MDGIGEALSLIQLLVGEAMKRRDEAAVRKAQAFEACLQAIAALRYEWETLANGLGYQQSAADKANPIPEAPSLHSDDVHVRPEGLHRAVVSSGLPGAFSRLSSATDTLGRLVGETPADRGRAILRVLTDNWVIKDALDGKPLDYVDLESWQQLAEATGSGEYNLRLIDDSLRLAWNEFARKAPADAKST